MSVVEQACPIATGAYRTGWGRTGNRDPETA